MLDDYSLRLLAEIGIDVYVPRAEAATVVDNTVVDVPARSDLSPGSGAGASAVAQAPQTKGVATAGFLIVCAQDRDSRLPADLLRCLRMAGLDAAIANGGQIESIAAAHGLLILGESLARTLGADMPAQRQNEIAWIVSNEPAVLAKSATAKRALWGEIKRLSRAQAQRLSEA